MNKVINMLDYIINKIKILDIDIKKCTNQYELGILLKKKKDLQDKGRIRYKFNCKKNRLN